MPNSEDFLAFLVFLERRKQNFNKTKNKILVCLPLPLPLPTTSALSTASLGWDVSRLLFEDIYK